MIGIYMIRNTVNNRVYIGQSIDVKMRIWHHKDRLKRNVTENWPLQEDWNKYGEEAFEFIILEECDKSMLDELERKYIQIYKSVYEEGGYNLENGGISGFKSSPTSVRKMTDSLKGRFAGENNPMYGRHIPHTEEWKQWASERFSGKGNPMYGVHLTISEERKKEMSIQNSGTGNPFYGKRHSEETKQKIREKRIKRAVRCVETGIVYESSAEADRQTGIDSGSICRSCKIGVKAGNYHWEYVV